MLRLYNNVFIKTNIFNKKKGGNPSCMFDSHYTYDDVWVKFGSKKQFLSKIARCSCTQKLLTTKHAKRARLASYLP